MEIMSKINNFIFKFDIKSRVALIMSMTFVILSIAYVQNTKLLTGVTVKFECSGEALAYIETHYRNANNNKIKRIYLNKKQKFHKVSFYIDVNECDKLYFYFGKDRKNGKDIKNDSVTTIKKITINNIFNSRTFQGTRLFAFFNKKGNKERKILKILGNTRVYAPFVMFSPGLNRIIEKLSKDKIIFYLLIIPMTFFLFFVISSFKIPRFNKFTNRKILVITFIFLIFIPITNNLFNIRELSYKIERLKKTIFRMSDISGSYNRFYKFHKKNFFYRYSIVHLNNLAKVKVFGVSPVNEVILGKEPWMFYAKENDNNIDAIDYYRGVTVFTTDDLRAWKKKIEFRYYWLKKRGIRYVFMVVPNKSTIYSGFLPKFVKKSTNKNRLDQLINYLKNTNSPVKILDLRKRFLKEKLKFKIYNITDSHWSDIGAFFGYKILMDRLKEYNINSFSVNLKDYSVEVKKMYLGGDLAEMLLLQDEYREDKTFLTPKNKNILINKTLKINRPFIDVSVKESKIGNIGTTIFIHDSFGYYFKKFLAQHFKRIIFIRDWNLHFYKKLIKKEKPVLIIEEMAERFLMNKKLISSKIQ
jgi:hypothetical protein